MSQLPWDRFGSATDDVGHARFDLPGAPAVVGQPPYEPPAGQPSYAPPEPPRHAEVEVLPRRGPTNAHLELQQWVKDAVSEALRQQRPSTGRKVMDKFAEIKKAVVAFIGSLLMVLTFVTDSFGWVLPSGGEAVLLTVIGILTTVMTWLVPNKNFVHVESTAQPPAA